MTDDRVWTAADWERLTPDVRHRVINDGIVRGLDPVSPEFLARVQAKGRGLLEERRLVDRPDGRSGRRRQ